MVNGSRYLSCFYIVNLIHLLGTRIEKVEFPVVLPEEITTDVLVAEFSVLVHSGKCLLLSNT